MQHARALVAVDGPELGEPERQIAVGAHLRPVDRDVKRAVHRLDEVPLAFQLHPAEEVLLVVLEVSRDLEQLFARDVGAVDRLVATPHDLAADEILDHLAEHRPLGVPEGEPGADQLVEREEIQLAPQRPVVALLGFFQPLQMLVELRLRGERRPVHALELRVALVTAPVGARERQDLEGLDVAGRLHVRAAAEIDEVAVLEVRDLFPFRDRFDDLDLVLLAARAKPLDRLGARDDVSLERQVLRDDLAHLLFDARGVLGRERLGVEVVIEAGLDRRTDRHLGAGAQALDGVRHHVRSRVSHPRQGIVRNVPLVAGPNGLVGAHANSIAARPELAPDQTATKSFAPIEGRGSRERRRALLAAALRGRVWEPSQGSQSVLVGTGGIEPPTPTVSR